MSSSAGKFNLRAMEPSDTAALVNLVTEFDGDLVTSFLIDAYAAIISGTEDPTLCVVVERAGYAGLIGMGTVRFKRVQFNGDTLPLAFLDGLKVHKDFRGQGLGYQIASWRIQRAREKYGDGCLIATGMLQENLASRAVARKWCREFIDPAFEALIMPVRKQAPKPLSGISVREIEPSQFEEFAIKQNRYYKNYNLYPPADPSSITNALEVSAEGRKPYRFFAAVDANGNLMAGAQTWARGLLKSDKINNPPVPLRILNKILHLFPSDLILRDVTVTGLWYEPNATHAARFLWEMIRWKCQDQGSMVAASIDRRDPNQEVITLKPWHQPRPKITVAVNGPSAINQEKLIFPIGRV